MKKCLLFSAFALFLVACGNTPETTPPAAETPAATADAPATDLPYKASYSSSFSSDVSDADLKMVLTTYKDWADGNLKGLEASMADSVYFVQWDGSEMTYAKADLMKMWAVYRDSLSSINIDMEAYHKMYSTDKKDSYIVTWYTQTDTYKSGRVDSAQWHDINQVKDGKIIWYSQYRRTKK